MGEPMKIELKELTCNSFKFTKDTNWKARPSAYTYPSYTYEVFFKQGPTWWKVEQRKILLNIYRETDWVTVDVHWIDETNGAWSKLRRRLQYSGTQWWIQLAEGANLSLSSSRRNNDALDWVYHTDYAIEEVWRTFRVIVDL